MDRAMNHERPLSLFARRRAGLSASLLPVLVAASIAACSDSDMESALGDPAEVVDERLEDR